MQLQNPSLGWFRGEWSLCLPRKLPQTNTLVFPLLISRICKAANTKAEQSTRTVETQSTEEGALRSPEISFKNMDGLARIGTVQLEDP